MNNRFKSLLLSSGFFISLIITACGGGSSSMGGIDGSGAPAVAGTVSTGAITGFGSVIVNGVRFNSDKAKILINDQSATEDNLRAGYQVKITGHMSTDGSSVADTIEFYPNVIGTISQIDSVTQELSVLNQRVSVNNATLFDAAITPNFLSGLKVGDIVLVSGFADSNGLITATRIELAKTVNRQVMGTVTNLNPALFTFTLKNQTVNYSSASFTNVSTHQIANSNLVVVSGAVDDKGVLQAKTITKINNTFDKDIKTVETEGVVTRYQSATDFDVAGVTWTTSTQTSFENGSSANLAQGAALSIKGELSSSGQLTAQKVEFKKVSLNEIVGEVTSVSAPTTGSVASGTLQVSGTTIQTNAKTAFEDKGSSNVKRFNFASISVGDFLKISGYTNQGNFVATKIEREDIQKEKETELKSEGVILSIDTHSFTLYGRTIVTNSQTEIKDRKGNRITEAQFYLQAIGQRAKVEGALKNGIFTAKKIELADAEDD